jgi:hypothetical protein
VISFWLMLLSLFVTRWTRIRAWRNLDRRMMHQQKSVANCHWWASGWNTQKTEMSSFQFRVDQRVWFWHKVTLFSVPHSSLQGTLHEHCSDKANLTFQGCPLAYS